MKQQFSRGLCYYSAQMDPSLDSAVKEKSGASPDSTRGQRLGALLALFLFSLPALQPLLNGRLTCGFDNVFHLWRSVQIGELLANGILFSRWAPHMGHGYGYPLYLYQAPFSAYLAAFVHAGGVSWTTALNVVYGLSIVASGWAMWLLACDMWGYRGALVAAVAYMFAPFHAYVVYFRASLSEAVAWVFVPLVLWGLWRWQGETRQRRGLVTAVLAFILLVFSHDVSAYAFFPLLAGWVGAVALSQKSWHSLGRGALALLLGSGGSAFFWLPAVVERPAIQFERANSAWPFTYFNNFLPLEQLLSLPRNADPTLLNDWPERGLGILLITLAAAGAVIAWRQLPRLRWLIGYLGLVLAGYIFLTVALSRPLWDTFSILQAFQFPWRFLAPATLAAALLSGGCVFLVEPVKAQSDQRFRVIAWPLALMALLSVAHWGWVYPQLCDAPADTSLAGMVAWEKETGTVGTSASRELLPEAVTSLPKDEYELPVWEARLAETDLPEGATILQADYGPLDADIVLETAVPFTARFRTFAFPGWRVWLNGVQTDLTPSHPDGLITFPVPAGQSTIRVAFGETWLRILANALSLISLAALVILITRPRGRPAGASLKLVTDQRRFLAAAIALTVILLGLKIFTADAEMLPVRTAQFTDGSLQNVAQTSQLTFGTPANPALVRLLGMGDLPTTAAADEPLTLFLYWQALMPLAADYRVGLVLLDENGGRWSEDGLRDYRWTRGAPPAPTWPPDQYVQTAFFVDLLSGTPPGTYSLQLSLFDPDTLTPLTVYQEGLPLGPAVELGAIEVTAPARPWPATTFTPQYQLDLDTESLQVAGATIDRETAAPGDAVLVTLFWQNESGKEQTGALSLLDAGGTAVAEWPLAFAAVAAGYFRQQQLLQLPPSLADGRYTWQLTVDENISAPFGGLRLTAPERFYSAPEMDTAVVETLYQGDTAVATLVGYSLPEGACQPGAASCTITLLWQAHAENNESYRVFVQLVAASGQPVAQHDGVPGNWQRPTTGWLNAEYIVDSHELALAPFNPEGDMQLIVGMYSAANGRLQTSDGREFISLPQP